MFSGIQSTRKLHQLSEMNLSILCVGRIPWYFWSVAISIWYLVWFIQRVFHTVNQSIKMVSNSLAIFDRIAQNHVLSGCFPIFAGLLILFVILLTTFTTMLVVHPLPFLADLFEIEPYTSEHGIFRLTILVLPLLHLLLSYAIEVRYLNWFVNNNKRTLLQSIFNGQAKSHKYPKIAELFQIYIVVSTITIHIC